jgi:hypothetical protein
MEIIFQPDRTLGGGAFIRVLRGGQQFGRIYYSAEVYRFYVGEEEKLGDADLHNADLGRLKAAIATTYARA